MIHIRPRMWIFKMLAICGLVYGSDFFNMEGWEVVPTSTMGSLTAYNKCGEGSRQGLDKCVVYHKCDPKTKTIVEEPVNKYGFGLIDIRFGENGCPDLLDVCCKIPQGGDPEITPTNKPITPTTEEVIPTKIPPAVGNVCGKRNNNGIDFRITGNNHNEAEYGEFPWMVALLRKHDSSLTKCGGSLIAPRVVLTGAHCVVNFTNNPNDLKVRAGEWDIQTEKERLPYQERDVTEIIIHEDFKDGILLNNVALLILNRPFKKAEHIGTICLPNQNERIISKNCFATGWGKNMFGSEGRYQMILKKIELPIVPRDECEALLKQTRLGSFFKLHESFICAGGKRGEDTCTGDGGSPLVCPDPEQPRRYVQTGIVSWGVGCGTNAPGVYADVAKFRNWVDSHMQRLKLSTEPYTV